MYVSFSGHRDKTANSKDLEAIADKYTGAIWVHGGAIGFDTQIETFARRHGIKTIIIRPDYQKYGKRASLVRNDEIVELGSVLVALYDGRIGGGTFYTIKKASEKGKEVLFLH